MDDNIFEVGLSAIFGFILFILLLPVHLLVSIPYWIICRTGLDKVFSKVAVKLKLGSEKSDPVKLEAWARNLYKNSDDVRINFDLIDEFRTERLDPKKYPSAHTPVPPNLERGNMYNGRLWSGKDKSEMFSGLHFNPVIWADSYFKTAGRSLAIATVACSAIAVALFIFLTKGMFGVSFIAEESWGGLGSTNIYMPFTAIGGVLLSTLALCLTLLPFYLVPTIFRREHDVLALNEVILDIDTQMRSYDGYSASKEEVSIYNNEIHNKDRDSKTLYDQRMEFRRVQKKGEPMVYMNCDDGTARSRGSIHGYEKGTPVMLTVGEMNQNTLISGKTGSGKTTGMIVPVFSRTVLSFMAAGYPIQGMGMDGKATLYIKLMKVLEMHGIPTDKFITVGVGKNHYGIPIFHGLSVEMCITILASTMRGQSDSFFIPSALMHMARVLRIAKAYHFTELGVEYEIKTGGCTTDSPEFVKRLCNNSDELYEVIGDLLDYLKNNPDMSEALYDNSLQSAIDGCNNEWRNALKAEETVSGVISSINVFLNPFTDNGEILERFGQGRMGARYKDIRLMMEDHFFFSALSDIEHGDAARTITIFLRSRGYIELIQRQIKYEEMGKDPQKEPVMLIMDEHQLLVSSGTSGITDASFFNISRSQGLCALIGVQSVDAYIPVIGKEQTENMIQQLITRTYLPTKSDEDARHLSQGSGHGYRLSVFMEGVSPSEGARELVNGGVMRKPRTSIANLSGITPIGLPRTLYRMDAKEMKEFNTKVKTSKITGYPGVVFQFHSGCDYVNVINSPLTAKKKKKTAFNLKNKFHFGGAFGQIAEGNEANSDAIEKEADMETRGRSEGIERVPLFTADDSQVSGNFAAILATPQFGVEHVCRINLEPMYI